MPLHCAILTFVTKGMLAIKVRESLTEFITNLRPYRRVLSAASGLLLFGIGAFLAYWWFYISAPVRHLADRDWLAAHSSRARWEEEQLSYRRSGASPDLCFSGDRINYYGDKQWLLWLISQITTNTNFRHCGCTETALSYMTNQESKSWQEWLVTYKDKSQEEWIREGFTKYGVMVHLPPQPEDTELLLKLIGAKTWRTLWGGPQEKLDPEIIPDFVQYNAFRWLRDSGFDPVVYATANAASANALAPGLIKYSKWLALFPARDELGILSFGKKSSEKHNRPQPKFKDPGFMVLVYTVILGPLLLSGGLLVYSIRHKSVSSDNTDRT